MDTVYAIDGTSPEGARSGIPKRGLAARWNVTSFSNRRLPATGLTSGTACHMFDLTHDLPVFDISVAFERTLVSSLFLGFGVA
jgi:hypothetical protein